jgi:hypothetical protein
MTDSSMSQNSSFVTLHIAGFIFVICVDRVSIEILWDFRFTSLICSLIFFLNLFKTTNIWLPCAARRVVLELFFLAQSLPSFVHSRKRPRGHNLRLGTKTPALSMASPFPLPLPTLDQVANPTSSPL